MNSMPKYVVSSTLERADWNNSTVINGDVAEEVAKLDGNILVAGSAQLVQTLMDHDLVDEYRLMIYPVLLGSGKRLFEDGVDTTALQIVETNRTGQVATVVLSARHDAAAETGTARAAPAPREGSDRRPLPRTARRRARSPALHTSRPRISAASSAARSARRRTSTS